MASLLPLEPKLIYQPEFWTNRVAITNLEPSQTRVPERPDQVEFISRWYDFHRGYRVVIKADGTEERIAVLGEPFEDVSPGQLPRTLDELREGRIRSLADQRQNIEVAAPSQFAGPSLDELLDNFIDNAENEDGNAAQITDHSSAATPLRIAGNVMQPTSSSGTTRQLRHITSIEHELMRMRQSMDRVVNELAEFGEIGTDVIRQLLSLPTALEHIVNERLSTADDTPLDAGALQPPRNSELDPQASIDERISIAVEEHGSATHQRIGADRTLASVRRRLAFAQRAMAEAQNNANIARQEERRLADVLQRLRRDRQSGENFRRVFGTREEMERDDYVSPIGGLFNRAFARYEDAEAERRQQRLAGRRRNAHSDTMLEEQAALLASMEPQWRTPPRQADTTMDLTVPSPPQRAASSRRHDALTYGFDGQSNIHPWPNVPFEDGPVWNVPTDFPVNPQHDDVIRNVPARYPHAHTSVPRRQRRTTELAASGGPDDRASYLDDVRRRLTAMMPDLPQIQTSYERRFSHPSGHSAVGAIVPDQDADMLQHGGDPGSLSSDNTRMPGLAAPDTAKGLDVDANRPEAKADEEMAVTLSCKICYTQLADTACLPCGHLVMCQWCSEQAGPTHRLDRTRPVGNEKCPLCRKKVKQKARIRLG